MIFKDISTKNKISPKIMTVLFSVKRREEKKVNGRSSTECKQKL